MKARMVRAPPAWAGAAATAAAPDRGKIKAGGLLPSGPASCANARQWLHEASCANAVFKPSSGSSCDTGCDTVSAPMVPPKWDSTCIDAICCEASRRNDNRMRTMA